MFNYKCCADVDIEKVYSGFMMGFSDYIIKLDLSMHDFVKRFLGPEGNNLEYSYIAFDGEVPVGVILGGIKDYEGVKTIRCGALCIHPDYRGKGISQELFRLHKLVAQDNNCKQMFLEVITGNDRAIKFYNNLGYEKIYDLSYFSLSNTANFKAQENAAIDIRKIGYDILSELSNVMQDIHINWQNDFDYMKKFEGITYYGAYKEAQLIGALGINAAGRIFFIWTTTQQRHNGIASSLVARAVKELELKKLSIGFPNNSRLEGFLKSIGFERDKISQYEMYLLL